MRISRLAEAEARAAGPAAFTDSLHGALAHLEALPESPRARRRPGLLADLFDPAH